MNMRTITNIGLVLALLTSATPVAAFVQFPYDIDNAPYGWATGGAKGTEDVDWNNNGTFDGSPLFPGTPIPATKHYHYGAGDGFSLMADNTDMYIFGFSDLTGVPAAQVMMAGELKAEFPGPTFDAYEGQEVYLTLTNVGMKKRPDLFDPHTVHFHGFPNASAVFDGEPMASFGIRMAFDLTYYYNIAEPGTYLYHCHVEATEHMEMGMLANLLIRPRQDIYALKYGPVAGNTRFAYNDCDNLPEYTPARDLVSVGGLTGPMCGSTGYDVEKLIQFSEFDPAFHDADLDAQPLPFADFEGRYFMFNGRGYPDTITGTPINNLNGDPAQKLDSRVVANSGQTILLRLSNLSIQNFAALEALGVPLKVVGQDAKLLRGPTGLDLSYSTNSVFIGPGQSFDVLIDTATVPAGTYYLYSRNLNQLNNNAMDRGGAMTEIVIN